MGCRAGESVGDKPPSGAWRQAVILVVTSAITYFNMPSPCS